MRHALALTLVPLVAACTFQVSVEVPTDGGAGDLAPPGPHVTLALDARSPSLWKAQAQPYFSGAASAHYRFDESGTGALVDHSGQGNDLAPVGGTFGGNRQMFTPLPTAGGFQRRATEFLGPGFVAASGGVLDVGTEDFTIEAWFKLPPGYSPASCDPIVSKGSGYRICVVAGGALQMLIAYPGGGASLTSTAGFADGAWHLATFVFKLTAPNAAAIFVDGVDFTPASHDLSLPSGKNLSNATKLFAIGGNGGSLSFRGSLAELAFFDGRAMTRAEAVAEYVAYERPFVAPVPAAAEVSYTRDSTVCSVLAVDPSAGERVACYGGGKGLPSQLALGFDAHLDATDNPAQLGVLTAPAGMNYVANSEHIERWGGIGAVQGDAAISPRGDQTAESVTVQPGNSITWKTPLAGNGSAVFSIWLRSDSQETVTLGVTDLPNGLQSARCTFSLSAAWKRYECAASFSSTPTGVEVLLVNEQGHAIGFDAWGAQLESGAHAGPYVPNTHALETDPGEPRAATLLRVQNSHYLDGASGRVEVAFIGAAGMLDDTLLFDTGPMALDRHRLGRGLGSTPSGEIVDAQGMDAQDSWMTAPALDWTLPHTLALAWSATDPLPSSANHTSLTVDGTTSYGRAGAYSAAAPSNLYLGSAATGGSQPLGLLEKVTIWSAP